MSCTVSCILMHCVICVISAVGKILILMVWSVALSFQILCRNSSVSFFSLRLSTCWLSVCFHLILTPDPCLSAYPGPYAVTVPPPSFCRWPGTQVHICCSMLEKCIVVLFHVHNAFSVAHVSCKWTQAGRDMWSVILQGRVLIGYVVLMKAQT